MAKKRKIYGVPKAGGEGVPVELSGVALCFSDWRQIRAFAKFAARCAKEARKNKGWDHAHMEPYKAKADVTIEIVQPSPAKLPKGAVAQGLQGP